MRLHAEANAFTCGSERVHSQCAGKNGNGRSVERPVNGKVFLTLTVHVLVWKFLETMPANHMPLFLLYTSQCATRMLCCTLKYMHVHMCFAAAALPSAFRQTSGLNGPFMGRFFCRVLYTETLNSL